MSLLLGCLAWALVGPALVRLLQWLLTFALLRRAVALLEWCAARSEAVPADVAVNVQRHVLVLGQRLVAKRHRLESLVLVLLWPVALYGVLRETRRSALSVLGQEITTRAAVAGRKLSGRAAAPVGG